MEVYLGKPSKAIEDWCKAKYSKPATDPSEGGVWTIASDQFGDTYTWSKTNYFEKIGDNYYWSNTGTHTSPDQLKENEACITWTTDLDDPNSSGWSIRGCWPNGDSYGVGYYKYDEDVSIHDKETSTWKQMWANWSST